jgi:WD40 repeat protein
MIKKKNSCGLLISIVVIALLILGIWFVSTIPGRIERMVERSYTYGRSDGTKSFSSDSKLVGFVNYSPDKVQCLTLSTEQLQSYHLRYSELTSCFSFSPDLKLLAVGLTGYGKSDHEILLYQVYGTKLLKRFVIPEYMALDCIFSPDGRWLIAGDEVGIIRIWQVADGKLVKELKGPRGETFILKFLSDVNKLAWVSSDGTVAVWQIPDGKLINKMRGGYPILSDALFTPDGQQVVLVTETGIGSWRKNEVNLWRISDGKLIRNIASSYDRGLRMALSTDGLILAKPIPMQLGKDEYIKFRLERLSDGTLIRELQGHCYDATPIFAPNGQQFAAISSNPNGMFYLWRISDGKLMSVYDISTGKKVKFKTMR